MLAEVSELVQSHGLAVLQRLGLEQDTPSATWKALSSRRKAADVMALLAGRLVEDDAVFDAKPYKLNCPNGVVDLKTGKIRPHRASDRFLLQTAADYVPGAVSNRWRRALEAVDADVYEWLRLRLGQSITGLPPQDHRILFLKGGGANGKSVLMDAVMTVLGGYAANIPPRVLLANPSDHSTERTTLMGVRLAVIEELPEQHISGVMLKQLVGVKQVTARRIGKDNVSFPVTWSLMLTTNYTPRLSDTDHGTWRRLAVVPFSFRFVKSPSGPGERKQDSALQLWKDSPDEGVLAWLVAAAVECFKRSDVFDVLPVSVELTTGEIRGENDQVSLFVEERLLLDQESVTAKSVVYEEYSAWVRKQGQIPVSSPTFAQRLKMTDVGQYVREVRASNVRSWAGVRVRPQIALVQGQGLG